MHALLHCSALLEGPATAAAVVLGWAAGVRLLWRRGKTALVP
jgi:hypothetical protein